MIMTGSFLRFLSLALVCIATAASVPNAFTAAAPDEQFVTIYSLSQEGDSLSAAGKKEEALKKYQQAQKALFQLKRANPNWNSKVVASRLSDLSAKMAALTRPAPEAPSAAAGESALARNVEPAASAANSSGTIVRLLDPGAEPRRVLRLQPKPGQIQTSIMVIKMAMNMEMAQMPAQSIRIPPMQMIMESTVKAVAENGDIRYETIVKEASLLEDPEVPAQMVQMMKSSMQGLVGLKSDGTMSQRGFSRDVTVQLSGDASPQIQQGLDQAKEMMANLNSPLPEEPVGRGARWEAIMPIKSQGMTLRQTITQEVIALEGDEVRLSTSLQQMARNQKITNPATPGVKVDVPQMNSKGAGNVILNLAQLLPMESSLKAASEMTMAMNMGNQRQNLGMKMDMEVTLREKK